MNPRTDEHHTGPWMRGPHHDPRRHGRDDFAAMMLEFGQPGGRRRGRGGRRRMRRGDVRAALLVLLAEETANGYRLMQEIEERSGGYWRPSPGSVYPALSQLEDEGLVQAEKADGRKTFSLTDEGSAYVKENREKLGEPWRGLAPETSEAAAAFAEEMRPLIEAFRQVASVGDDDAMTRGAEVVAEARRKLYAILAEEPAKKK